MTILIIRVTTQNDPFTNVPLSRTAQFIINSGGGPYYRWNRGGLPLAGGVQAMLDAEADSLYVDASTSGLPATGEEIAQAESRSWFVTNGGAVTAIFGGTVTQLDANITNLIAAMFPGATAAQRTQMRYALMAGVLACRGYANGEGLV